MKKGFTLVELLAVIVILAVILVIAVPQINNVIKETRKNSLGSTAKLIAAKAEEKEVENDALEISGSITCEDLVKLDDNYGNCTVTKNSTTGKWEVTIVGANKFSGYTCTGTKDNMSCTEGSSIEEAIYAYGDISNPNEGVSDPTTFGKPFFLKYPLTGTYDNTTADRYVCILYRGNTNNDFNCFKWNDYDNEKTHMIEVFGNNKCSIGSGGIDDEYVYCELGNNQYCMIQRDGVTHCWDDNLYEDCTISSDGTAHCGEISD